MMDKLNNFEIFMLILSTPFIVAAIWHMCSKYFGGKEQVRKH